MLELNGPNDFLWKVVRNQEAAQGLAGKTNRTPVSYALYFTIFSISKYLSFPKVLDVSNKVSNIFAW